ncbi:minor capsid protein [Staphylococcus epidermidis]|uniref:minor capsid protein n=1 Tax=Staphylococcus epidermidis TaxID=1282 RepID=UPI001934238E|nr:minor capsid protein [Staphylococcus epidermidis]MBM0772696.1 phage head morphogenesis protein [Staphylococcus epidermidis]
MSYWEDRAKEIIKEETLSDREMSKEIERIVNEMIDDIEKEIAKFYARYATSEGISMSEARKKVDAFDVIKFANQAKKYVDTQDFSDRANEELRAYNTKMYVSREELLKAQIGLLVTYTYAKLESQMHNYLESAYYRALKQQAGILGDTLQVASTDVKAIVLAPFQNSNWSRRLWRDMRKTRIQVQRAVTHVIIRGRHPYEFVKELRKESGNSTYEIRRLLITETARVQTIATKQHMLENQGPDAEYKYVAKLDSKTTKTCRGLNGKVFKVKDMKPGVNAPPMHPFCRSSVVPYVGDWKEEFFEKRKGKYAFGGIVE